VRVFTICCMFFVSIGCANSAKFTATQRSLMHADGNSNSDVVGVVEVGETVDIVGHVDTRWIEVTKDSKSGWVYKSRGSVTAQLSSGSQATSAMRFWFGNIHSHTGEDNSEPVISKSTHEDAFLYAMDDNKGNLDFLAVTPHNHLVADNTYQKLRSTVTDSTYYKPGKFVPLAGQEFSSIASGNHINVFELTKWIKPDKTKDGRDNDDDTVKNGDYKDLYTVFIPKYMTGKTFGQFNHPNSSSFSKNKNEYGRDEYGEDYDAWIHDTDNFMNLIEITNAPSHRDFTNRRHYDEKASKVNAWLWALSKGWHLAPAANQDNHYANWGSASDTRTVAIAPVLTRDAITQAFVERRAYATEDSTLEVTFRSGDNWMGSIIDESDFSSFTVMVDDPEEPEAIYTVWLYQGEIGGDALRNNSSPIRTLHNINNAQVIEFDDVQISANDFYFIKVVQSNNPGDPNQNTSGDNAWTAPIWIKDYNH